MKPILELHDVSKSFSISHRQLPYLTFRETLANIFRSKERKEVLWALRNITFNIAKGETVGIIGKNGSGKSTLLKILSKITPPTTGKIVGRGRMASLLEVGTGFHPELTGIENIYLNGAILGMGKGEIKSKIDDIIAFSEVEKFLDTPLKRYSSGMKLRLAFAVAAFLEPEILVIDEVLAVGDVEFQRKCLKKMKDSTHNGQTLIFVSHNLQSVEEMCTKTALLEDGRVKKLAPTRETITAYLQELPDTHIANATSGEINFDTPQKGTFIAKITLSCDNKVNTTCYTGCAWTLQTHIRSEVPLADPVLGITIYDVFGSIVLDINSKNYVNQLSSKPLREGILSLDIPDLPLIAGVYTIDVSVGEQDTVLDIKRSIAQLNVTEDHSMQMHKPVDQQLNRFFFKNLIWKAEKHC